MSGMTLKCEALNTKGMEANGFYANIDKFDKWQAKYKFDSGVKELFYALNWNGSCFSYDHSRIHKVASILYTEDYVYTFPKEEKTVKISGDNFDRVVEDVYCNYFKCPSCGDDEVLEDHKYCPFCGVKFQWVAKPDVSEGRGDQ